MSVGSTTRRSVQVSGFAVNRLLTPPRCLYPLRVPRTSAFPDLGIVSPLTTQLSWSHVVEVLALKSPEARLFYLGEAANRQLATRELRRMLDRKALERKEITNAQLTEAPPLRSTPSKTPTC